MYVICYDVIPSPKVPIYLIWSGKQEHSEASREKRECRELSAASMSDSAEELALLQEAAGLLGRTLDPVVIYRHASGDGGPRDGLRQPAGLDLHARRPADPLRLCLGGRRGGGRREFPPMPLEEEGRGMQSRVIRSGRAADHP